MISNLNRSEMSTTIVDSHALAGLVSETPFGALTTTQNIALQRLLIPEIGGPKAAVGLADGGVNQWPTACNPVTVASIHELVRASRESTFWSILPSRNPVHACGQVEVPSDLLNS